MENFVTISGCSGGGTSTLLAANGLWGTVRASKRIHGRTESNRLAGSLLLKDLAPRRPEALGPQHRAGR